MTNSLSHLRRKAVALRYVCDIKKHRKKGKILDVGCGPGTFLEAATNAGFDATGIDISSDAINSVRKKRMKAFVCAFDGMKFQPESFDVVTMFSVLQYLGDPLLALERIHQILRCGGLLYIHVPQSRFKPSYLEHLLGQVGFHVVFRRKNALPFERKFIEIMAGKVEG